MRKILFILLFILSQFVIVVTVAHAQSFIGTWVACEPGVLIIADFKMTFNDDGTYTQSSFWFDAKYYTTYGIYTYDNDFIYLTVTECKVPNGTHPGKILSYHYKFINDDKLYLRIESEGVDVYLKKKM